MKLVFKHFYFIAILMFNMMFVHFVYAASITVNSIANLQLALNSAASGDTISLANGTYLNNVININRNGITVRAVTPGAVYLNGTNDININGNNNNFVGFQFTAGDIGTGNLIEVYGSNNVLSHLNFSGFFAKKYIEIKAGSQYNQVAYCNIEKKPLTAELGCTIQVSTSPTVPGYHRIRYCSFQNFYGLGGDNGNEPVRIGLSTESLNNARNIVEFCYFNNTGDGDSESVSIKSRENTVRFCTFTNQQNAMLCFRNGDNNVAYSNFFINAGGIRVKEANNIFCYNNYFQNSGIGSSADAVTYVYFTANTTNVLNNVNFFHNTFYNCGFIDLGGVGAINNTWANNIFVKSSGSIFKNNNNGTTWTGNMYQGTLGITIASGMANTNPTLALNSDNYFALTATSPAINASSSAYPAIYDIPSVDDDNTLSFDISGQARPTLAAQKDVGCDEFTTGNTTNRPLTLLNVGPCYLGGPQGPCSSVPTSVQNINFTKNYSILVFPNPAANSIQLQLKQNITTSVKVSICNLQGQVVKTIITAPNSSIGSNSFTYNVAELKNGTYFIKVITNQFSETTKLIIQK
jgi:hypothetical protein